MPSRPVWMRQKKLLTVVYGEKLTEKCLIALNELCGDVTDEVLAEGIKRHINNPDGTDFPPQPKHIRQTERELRADAERLRKAAIAKAEDVITFPALHDMVSTNSHCKNCDDRGLFFFWLPREMNEPKDKYEAYLLSEVRALSPERQELLHKYSAVCDCAKGDICRERYATSVAGFEADNGRRYKMPTRRDVERVAAKRARRDAFLMGAVANG